ncbi:MAG TPA: glycoside hydrolase family 28 protein [Verrucomicrobiae bacterium]
MLIGATGCARLHSSKDDPQADAAVKAWDAVPTILAGIVPPRFPDRDFVVTSYGAVADGVTDNSEAFRKAIDACSQSGGGRVVVPAGTFLTGAIHLENNVDLYLDKKALVRFTTNTDAYLPPVFTRYEGTEVMNYSPLIYAFEQTNIAVTGKGTFDGQGLFWHQWWDAGAPARLVKMATSGVPVSQRIFGGTAHLRPNFVEPVRCRNVLIEGIRLINSPMWVLSPVYCTNVTVRGVTIDTKGFNTDGCDPDSCNGVLIKDCTFSDGDDCIAIKSGRDADGQRINIPCQNLVIEDCNFEAGHGGVAIGSETAGGVQNVFAQNDRFNSSDLEMAMRFKTNPARGGFIKNAYFRDCTIKTAQVGISMTLRYSSSGAMKGSAIPIISDIDIRDCTFDKLQQPIFIQGWSPTNQITDITIANCHFLHADKKSFVKDSARIYLPETEGSGLAQKAF